MNLGRKGIVGNDAVNDAPIQCFARAQGSIQPENGVKIAISDGQALYGAQSMEPGDFATTTGGEIEPRAVSGVNELGGH